MFNPKTPTSTATPSPFTVASSEVRSALSSVFASSTSFFARSVAFVVISPISSRRGRDRAVPFSMVDSSFGRFAAPSLGVVASRSCGRPRSARSSWRGLAVDDLPLVIADGQLANLSHDLVQTALENLGPRMRGWVLAKGRPHPSDLALDILGGGIE